MKKKGKNVFWVILISILLILSIFGALTIGRYQISLSDCLKVLAGQTLPDRYVGTVIRNIRIPRVLLAVIIGAGLSVAGAAFQGMFSNPLATPDTLGVSAGASFGAALAILIGLPSIGIQLTAFVFGIAAIIIVFFISRVKNSSSLIVLVLSGVIIRSLFEAMISIIKYTADPTSKMPEITYWLMGSLSGVGMNDVLLGTPLIIISVLVLFLLRWKLNILSLHEEEAKSLGVNLPLLRGVVIAASTLITASTVAMCGQVSWVGLLIPHASRMIFGNNNKYVIPASMCIGAIFMLVIDTLARSLTASEIPISILTALIGAPLFVILLRRTGGIRA